MKKAVVVKSIFSESENFTESPLAFYLKRISKFKQLSPENEKKFAKLAAEGDTYARTRLIQANLGLVVNIARKSIHVSKLSMADLIQEGNIGLMVALDKFDYRLGYKFSTYACWWIKQALFKAISEQAHCMKIPVYIQETLSKYKKIKHSLEQKYGCEIKNSVVADKMGISEDKINLFLNAFTKSLSIENTMSNDEDKDLSLADIIEDVSQNVEIKAENDELKDDIKRALEILKDKEQNVLALRFGLEEGSKKTLEEIGNIYGVTKECIRQIEKRAIRKIYADNEIRCRLLSYMS